MRLINRNRAAHLLLLAVLLLLAPGLRATPLDDYVHAPDTNFAWKVVKTWQQEGFTIVEAGFISQRWQGELWTNFIWILKPPELHHPEYCALFIGGDNGSDMLREAGTAAQGAGAWAVVLSRVPNQPLFDGRKEDALIAYTFAQYLRTGDGTWPALLPMVKSAVRAMDLTQRLLEQQNLPVPKKFVVTGASKRGWTTWLTAAEDSRVVAIAPRVFDTLNMPAQTEWAKKVYGRQSEKIHDYADAGITDKMDSPAMQRLCAIVDPYAYRDRLMMPKLVLLGANDPYWTVDSPRHYWNALPEPKLLFEAPNAGHGLAPDSQHAFAAFYKLIAEGKPLPEVHWQMNGTNAPGATVTFNEPVRKAELWTAAAPTRDFRPAKWTSRDLAVTSDARELSASVAAPTNGYAAFMVVLTMDEPGQEFKLSTQVQVVPDN